jgi:type IV pilus assembly protein PilY1
VPDVGAGEMKKSAVAVVALFAVAGSAPRSARAQQTDTNPPLPNVLLLIDNSGSMDRMIDGSLPESSPGTTCNCTEVPGNPPTANCNWAAQPSTPNRWGILTQALTGSIKGGYNCLSMPRTAGSTFATEYQIDNVPPYDTGYYLNDYRPIAEDTSSGAPVACVYAPGLLPGANAGLGVGPNGAGSGAAGPGSGQAATDFPPTAAITRPYGALTNTTPGSCQFNQYSDGVIPSFTSFVRFGMMTFDNDPSQGTGVTAATPILVNNNPAADPQSSASGAFVGMWSYYPGWSAGGSCPYAGNPANCATSTTMAVGSRNPAAPPWEGRMVMFPTTNDLPTQELTNANVSTVISATRPYGGTPMAGMFQDAQYYFWQDPNGPQQTDPQVQASLGASHSVDAGANAPCRREYIILLTDGAPNEDMRPDCAAAGAPAGSCPFPQPETTAYNLYAGTATGTSVTTFVIGFAVSSVQDGSQNVACSTLVANGTLSSKCAPSNPTNDAGASLSAAEQALYAPCCELQRIALAGTGNNPQSTPAFFADTPEALQDALNTILGQVSSQATSRTVPAYAPTASTAFSSTTSGAQTTNAEVFLASFDPGVGVPWTGDVVRQRYSCQYAASTSTFSVPPPTIDPTQGDDFAKDLNSNAGSISRTFIAFEPNAVIENSTTVHDSTLTIRPYITATPGDGFPIYGATTYAGSVSTLVSDLTPDALNVTNNTCSYTSTSSSHAQKTLTANDCMTAVLDFETAQATFGGGATDFPFQSRAGSALGDIYHATPVDVGPPGSLLQDPLYTAFQGNISPARKNIVYAASNDGILHAFWADVPTLENNEEWALIPPAALANLAPSYPSSHAFLLDGRPVVKDVVWDRNAASVSTASGNPWHTMLVEGFGEASSLPGYIAVDVTQPDPSQLVTVSGSVPSASPPNAPVLRWQLSTVPAHNFPLFGLHSGTPTIATLFMDPGDGNGARDIGVAVLPGGQTGTPTTSAGNGAACERWSNLPQNTGKYSDSAPIGTYVARTGVRCWGGTGSPTDTVAGRDLMIVRLDTGEILRVFTRLGDVQNNFTGDTLLAASRITDVPFDSPIVGTPIIYPADVGTDTTKIFVGDADGTLWRIDVSDSNPANWTGGLYLDAYNQTVDTNATAWSDGQPFGVSPTLSVNAAGQLVMNAATTTTDQFDTSGIYMIYSLTEAVQGTLSPALRAQVNWYINSPLTNAASTSTQMLYPGERVSGPMTVFNGELFLATYAANTQSSTVSTCNNGTARIWGMDYQIADTANPPASGGKGLLNDLPPHPTTNIVQFVTPSAATGGSGLAGVVIPGVSIRQSPACASASTGVNPLGGGSYNSVGSFAPSTYSMFAQLGQANPSGLGANTLNISLNPPIMPLRIDSWAGIFE